MSIRRKTLLTICATLTALVAVLFIMSRMVLMDGFTNLENRDARKNVGRVQKAFSEMIAGLDAKASDWASWDDTYAFVEDGNSGYVTSNLSESAFAGMRLNMVLIMSSSGKLVYGQSFDLKSQTLQALPSDILEHVAAGSALLTHATNTDRRSGLIMLSNGPLMVVSHPILNSSGEGPIRGSLIFARYLDADQVHRLSDLTQLSVAAYRLDKDVPADFGAANSALSPKAPIVVTPLTKSTIAGYTVLKDIYGRPCVIVRADMPREIYSQGTTVVRYLMLGLILAGLVFAVVMITFMDRLVLRRIAIANLYAAKAMSDLGLQ